MRASNSAIINAVVATGTVNSTVLDATNVFCVSAQIVSSSGSNAGSLQLQFSNDLPSGLLTDSNGKLIPVNWSNLGSAATVTSGGLQNVQIPQSTYAGYRWLRAVWTPSSGAGTITVNAVTLGM